MIFFRRTVIGSPWSCSIRSMEFTDRTRRRNCSTICLKEKVKGATVAERAKSLAKIRDTEGYMSQFVADEGSPQILECHTPLQNVLDKYPIIGRLEQEMFEQLLGTRVRRQETRNSGLYECAFYFAA